MVQCARGSVLKWFSVLRVQRSKGFVFLEFSAPRVRCSGGSVL